MSGFGVVLLAAGGSTRMGRPKQLLAHRWISLIEHGAYVATQSCA